MKKFYSIKSVLMGAALILISFVSANAQTCTSPLGAFGSFTFTGSTCNGIANTITTCAWAGEYSDVNGVLAGNTYTVTNSPSTDFIYISDLSNTVLYASGSGSVTFTATVSGSFRIHSSTTAFPACGTQTSCRTRTVSCTGTTPPPPAPANNLCTSPTFITCGSIVSGTTLNATTDAVPFCGTSGGVNGVWYLFIGNGDIVTLSTCGASSVDTKINVYRGTCSGLICVTGNDDACGLQSLVTFPSIPGTAYFIMVSQFSAFGTSGAFDMSVTCVTPQPGDICSSAFPIACNTTTSGSTVGYTGDNTAFCGTSGSASNPGRWYSFVGDGSCTDLTTCASVGFDTKLQVWRGTCTSLICVAGNDDAACAFSFLRSSVNLGPTIVGATYYVLVYGFGSSSGNFNLTLNCVPPPANDLVCGAVAIPVGGSAAWDNSCATASAGEVSPGAGSGTNSCDAQDGWCSFETAVNSSLWYTFVAPAGGCVSIATNNTADMQLAVWSVGSCGSFSTFTEIAANDDGGVGFAPLINQLSCLTPGATYYIQLDGFGTTRSSGTLSVTDCGNAPLACDLGACQSRFIGYAPAEDDTNFINGTVSGGFPPYTYSWSGSGILYTNGAQAAVQPNTPGANVYTLTVTDSRGCVTTCTVTVNTYDVAAPCSTPGNVKIQVCHVPPGNPDAEHNICINESAVDAHWVSSAAGGHDNCYLGPCGNECLSTGTYFDPPPPCASGTFSVFVGGPANYRDVVDWTIKDVGGFVVASGEPYGFGTIVTTSVNLSAFTGPFTFDINALGTFTDNVADWSVSCGGVVAASGTVRGTLFGGPTTAHVEGICCGSVASPRLGASAVNTLAGGVVVGPNPFTTTANFQFRSVADGNANLEIFSITGTKVATVHSGNVEAGQVYDFAFTPAGDLANGVYIWKMTTSNGGITTGKLVYNK